MNSMIEIVRKFKTDYNGKTMKRLSDQYVRFEMNIGTMKEEAKAGDAESQFHLAFWLYMTHRYKKSVKWLKRAVKQGHQGAGFQLAWMYYDGDGVEEDKDKAIEILEELSEKGFKEAKHVLNLIKKK